MTITLDGPTRAGDAFDRVDRMDAAEASPERLFSGDGSNMSAFARKQRDGRNPRYLADLDEAHRLYDRVLSGNRRAALDFCEAMSTSDLPIFFGDIIDREVLANYASQPVQWDKIAKRGKVRDFRTVKRFTMDGGEAVLAKVKQLAPYPAAAITDAKYEYAVEKYGRRFPLSFEALVSGGELDVFADLPARLGKAARRTEERFVTDLYAGTTGPDGTFYSTANKNTINATTAPNQATVNPPLSIASLQVAMQLMDSQIDTDGAPIYVEGVTLVVPPALKVAAMNIISAVQVLVATGSGSATTDQLTVNNWMAGGISVVVNPWLPLISTTNGHTSWYLFANPTVGRPAMEMGFLMGHEAPELFRKSPNALRVSGGLASPDDGDFDSDAAEWKIRLILGGVLMDPKSSVSSSGAGS